MKRTRGPVAPAPRSRTLGQRTATGPMPVWISRSGKCPWRTIRRRPAEPVRCAYASTKPATSASTACPSKRRAPRRKTSVSGSSSNDPDWRSWTTVSSLMAYPSFVENGDSNIARIRRPHLIPSPTFDGAVKSRWPTGVLAVVFPVPRRINRSVFALALHEHPIFCGSSRWCFDFHGPMAAQRQILRPRARRWTT